MTTFPTASDLAQRPIKAYAGIGSRAAPGSILTDMENIGEHAAHKGYSLFSGNAQGSDQAFARGASRVSPGLVHLMLPWPSFEREAYIMGNVAHEQCFGEQAKAIAESQWTRDVQFSAQKRGVQRLMARNVHQVLGPNLNNPVEFVIMWSSRVFYDQANRVYDCWGGTGMAVRIAYANNIMVYDLNSPKHRELINRGLGTDVLDVNARPAVYVDQQEDGLELG